MPCCCRPGLRPERIWYQRLRHQWDRSSFWDLASGSGANRLRLSRVDATARSDVLTRAQSGLSRLAPQDFLWEGAVICAVATKGTTAAN